MWGKALNPKFKELYEMCVVYRQLFFGFSSIMNEDCWFP